jgi:hypothetical protein
MSLMSCQALLCEVGAIGGDAVFSSDSDVVQYIQPGRKLHHLQFVKRERDLGLHYSSRVYECTFELFLMYIGSENTHSYAAGLFQIAKYQLLLLPFNSASKMARA